MATKKNSEDKRGVLYAVGNSQHSEAIKLRRDGTIFGREKGDIVINDHDKGEVGWMRAKGGTYEPFRRLCSVPTRSHYAMGDLNGDGIPDLAVTLSDSGILRIYDGKALVRKSLEKSR